MLQFHGLKAPLEADTVRHYKVEKLHMQRFS